MPERKMMSSLRRVKAPASIRTEDEAILTGPSSPLKVRRESHVKSNSLVGFDPLLIDTDGSSGSEAESRELDGMISRASPSPPITPGQPRRTTTALSQSQRTNSNSLGRDDLSCILERLSEDMNNMSMPNMGKDETPKPNWGAKIQSKFTGSIRGKVENPDSPSHKSRPRSFTQESPVHTLKKRLSLTPPSKFLRRSSSESGAIVQASPELTSVQIPLLVKPSPTSFLNDATDPLLRTSEQEPSKHQIDIPTLQDVTTSMKICDVMGDGFAFDKLVGISNMELKRFSKIKIKSAETSRLTDEDAAPIQRLLACSENITVEGYVNKQSAEAVVLDLPARAEIVVALRGSKEQQMRPVRGKSMASMNGVDESLSVLSCFSNTWNEIESHVCGLIDKAADSNPFANIIFTGHSYGGALAQLAAVRYAANRPASRVSAYCYGSPKVGAATFRLYSNSISNLKVFRIELKDDTTVNTPLDFSSKFEHIGHSIVLGSNQSPMMYQFDRFKPQSGPNPFRSKAEARDTIAYSNAIDSQQRWAQDFVGVGDGVRGKDDEKRQVV